MVRNSMGVKRQAGRGNDFFSIVEKTTEKSSEDKQKTLPTEVGRAKQNPAMTYFPVISIIGAGELNCCVRNGNRCDLSARIAGKNQTFEYTENKSKPIRISCYG